MKAPPKFDLVTNDRDRTRFFVLEYSGDVMTVNVFDFIHTEATSDWKHSKVHVRIRLLRGAGNASLRGRPNILIDPEQVRRVVPRLHLHQAIVVRAVGSPDPLFAFHAEEVHVNTPRRERLGGGKEGPCPLHVRLVLVRLGPYGIDVDRMGDIPSGEGRCLLGNAAHGAAHQGQQRIRGL